MAKNYNFLQRDDNDIAIMTGTGIQTYDATATPQTSPLPMTTGIKIFAVPPNAAEMVVSCDVDMHVSEVADMSTYFTIAAGTTQVFTLANTSLFYIRMATDPGTLQFYFVLVQ